MKTFTVNQMGCSELDELVKRHYGKHFCYQQQGEARDRGMEEYSVPDNAEDFSNKTLPYEDEGVKESGVAFETWLNTDADAFDCYADRSWKTAMWWECYFYPDTQMLLNDMVEKGYIPKGEYQIIIDW